MLRLLSRGVVQVGGMELDAAHVNHIHIATDNGNAARAIGGAHAAQLPRADLQRLAAAGEAFLVSVYASVCPSIHPCSCALQSGL